jgi:o-succinylbenzoate synthase
VLKAFEDSARANPRKLILTSISCQGKVRSYSLHQVRLFSSALAQCLRKAGVKHGHYVSVDLPNVVAWPFLVLAAAYGNFALVAIDNSLSAGEKATRLMDLERMPNMVVSYHVNEANVDALLEQARQLIDGANTHGAYRASQSQGPSGANARDSHTDMTKLHPSLLRKYSTDEEESVVHYADHSVHLFDASKAAIVMFTAGSTGPSKAVILSWENLYAAAKSSNEVLETAGSVVQNSLVSNTVWQSALPFSSIGGMEVLVRCIAKSSVLLLNQNFDAENILSSASLHGATHIAISATTLQKLIAKNDARLKHYRCILLNENNPRPSLLKECAKQEIQLYFSYGMTETTSIVACEKLSFEKRERVLQQEEKPYGFMHFLPGIEARIVDPDPDGYGKLALRGKAIFGGYLNAYASFSPDGYFITNDTARLIDDGLCLRSQAQEVFICAGEVVEPARLRAQIMQIQGVSDAFVFATPDAKDGKRAVVFAEHAQKTEEAKLVFSKRVASELSSSVSGAYAPKFIFSLEHFPRRVTGEAESELLFKCFEERIEFQEIHLSLLKLPCSPERISAAKNSKKQSTSPAPFRYALVAKVIDHEGRVGFGESVLHGNTQESTARASLDVAANVLAPILLGRAFLHPGDVSSVLAAANLNVANIAAANQVTTNHAATNHAAANQAAANHAAANLQRPSAAQLSLLEIASWDIYGKITGKPLWQLIGGAAQSEAASSVRLAVGARVPEGTVQETVERTFTSAEAGYRRIKIDISPGSAFERIRAVRRVFTDIAIALNAQELFTEENMDELLALDKLGISWIEDPIAFDVNENGGFARYVSRLSNIQKQLRMPICVNHPIRDVHDAYDVLNSGSLRCVAVDINRFGGVRPALDFIRKANAQGVYTWMDGSHGLGLVRRICAAFQTLSSVTDAGDFGSVCRAFDVDAFTPHYAAERGLVSINNDHFAFGAGCELDEDVYKKFEIDSCVVTCS